MLLPEPLLSGLLCIVYFVCLWLNISARLAFSFRLVFALLVLESVNFFVKHLLLVLQHLDSVQILSWETDESGKEFGFVVVLYIVDSFAGIEVFVWNCLELLKQQFIVEKCLPEQAIVIRFFVEIEFFAWKGAFNLSYCQRIVVFFLGLWVELAYF